MLTVPKIIILANAQIIRHNLFVCFKTKWKLYRMHSSLSSLFYLNFATAHKFDTHVHNVRIFFWLLLFSKLTNRFFKNEKKPFSRSLQNKIVVNHKPPGKRCYLLINFNTKTLLIKIYNTGG